ncbi:transglycosylase SLT domain-containing protein [Peribacillus sp. FSL M8-0224]|uniref:transglycosylase SLT domain-containing protein n=1 Tax=Peribacillus sp. FSL M8-0224 TaxID=2921568 RepID=UPI0030FAE9FC|nr:transglycosylase SLT domain-containing protein [Brevibacterium sp. PAMC21349]
MKSFLVKTGLLVACMVSLFHGKATAESETEWSLNCEQYGDIKPNENPTYQHINCLLTNAAIQADIPPEVVKGIATRESYWRQFVDGKPFISKDGGIGIMQITDTTLPEEQQERLKNDILYNIETGVRILNSKASLTTLPSIKGAGRDIIENWYFPVMAYNGVVPVNSPLYQETGEINHEAYQELVFRKIEKDSFGKIEEESYRGDTILARYPFDIKYFKYDRESDKPIEFLKPEYIVQGVHETTIKLKAGDRVLTTEYDVKLRKKPGSPDYKRLPINTPLLIEGTFEFDESEISQNQFVWFPAKTLDGQYSGYVSSAYIEKQVAFKAASSSYNSIKTSWAAVSGASGYEIYRSTSSTGTYSKVGTTTSTSFMNSGLTTNQSYYYKMRAYQTVGSTRDYSNYSAIVTAKPLPAVPSSVKAASSSYNSIKTSWAAVSGASGYEIYRSTSSAGTYSKVGTTTSTSFMNSGLTTNQSYYYKMRAYRTVGSTRVYSNYSAIVTAKPLPAVPSSVKAASSSYNSVRTSWTAVSGASGYEVYRATSSTGTYSLAGSTTSTSYTNTGLTTNKPYYYKIRAYRTVGSMKVYSNYSTVVTAKPVPTVPTNFKATRISSTSLKLTWVSVSGASGYELYRSTSFSGTYNLLKSTTSLYYTNSSLTTGKTYYYKLRAYRTVGTTKVYSGWTTIISAKP